MLAPVHPVLRRKAGFHIKIMGAIPDGFRLLARQEKEVQEVFAVTTLDRAGLQRALDDTLRPDLYRARPLAADNPNRK